MNEPIEFTKSNGSPIAIGRAAIKFVLAEESQDHPNTRCLVYTDSDTFARVRESYQEVVKLWKGQSSGPIAGTEIK